jgi:hypothetical protein
VTSACVRHRYHQDVNESLVRATGLVAALTYAAVIGWILARQPQTAAQVSGGLASLVNAYHVDQQAFDDGVGFFHRDLFEAARAAFNRADPAERDARTQFYIAYAFYRQGWGRLSIDRALYEQGLQAVDRAIANAPGGRIIVDDPQLQMHSGDELRAEISRGLESPVHPLQVFGSRK